MSGAADALDIHPLQQRHNETSYFVIQFQRDLAASRSAEVSALANYQKAKTALQRATGTILDDYQIVLDDAFRGAVHPAIEPPSTAR